MAISIKSDYIALIGQNIINKANKSLSTSMQRLSTGYKINSAIDDPAGYVMISGLNTQLRGLKQAYNNNQNSYTMLSVAQSAITNVHDIANRLRELALEGSNNTMTQEQRSSLQTQANQLTKELFRIINSATYNDQQILGKSSTQSTSTTQTSAFETKTTVSHAHFTPLTEEEAIAQGYTFIKSEQDFLNMYKNATGSGSDLLVQGKYILMCDIDATSINSQLERIVHQAVLANNGVFDGNGHTISNLKITNPITNSTYTDVGGLFARSKAGSAIMNLTLKDIEINSKNAINAGGLVGSTDNTLIFNVHVSGKIIDEGSTNSYRNFTGGLVGNMTGRTIAYTSFVGDISFLSGGATSTLSIEGIAGNIMSGTITDCYSNLKSSRCAPVTNAINYGGIAGMSAQSNFAHNYVTIEVFCTPAGGNPTILQGSIVGNASSDTRIDYASIEKKERNLKPSGNTQGTINGTMILETDKFYTGIIKLYIPENIYLDKRVDRGFELNNGYGETFLQVGYSSDPIVNRIDMDFVFDIEGFYLNFTSAKKCNESIEKIDKLLNMTSTKQAQLGATMNRLESIMTNQTTMVENVSSALSSIQDADIAEETANYVKAQIQAQTASSLYSQVRSLHYEVTMMLLESVLSL